MEPSSSKSPDDLLPCNMSQEDSPVVASSSDNAEISPQEIPESSFQDAEEMSCDYEVSCAAQSSHFQPDHSDMSEMPGSSKVSVCVVQSSEVPESSLIIEQYSLSHENSLSPQSTTLLNAPAVNLQIQPSSSSDDGPSVGIGDFELPMSPSAPIDVHDMQQHDKVISSHDEDDILQMVGSSADHDMEREIQSSDIQTSCHSRLTWPSGPSSHVDEASTTSQDNQEASDLVSYSLADQHSHAHYAGSGYHEAHYALNAASNQSLVYSSVRFRQPPRAPSPHYSQVQAYGDISSLADSYHNAPSSSGIQMFSGLPDEAAVESSSAIQIIEVVSSNDGQQPGNSEADAVECVNSQIEGSPTNQLDSTSDNPVGVVDSSAVDSTENIRDDLSEIPMASSTGTDISVHQMTVAYQDSTPQNENFVTGNNLLVDPSHSVEHHASASSSSVSTSSGHQYTTLASVIPMEDYPSTSNGHFGLANIGSGFCEVNEGNQHKMFKNLIQHQAFMTAMLQPARSFDENHIELPDSERKHLLIGSSLPHVSSSTSSDQHLKIGTVPCSSDVELAALSSEVNPTFFKKHQDDSNHGTSQDPESNSMNEMEVSAESLDLSTSGRLQKINPEMVSRSSNLDQISHNSYWCYECNMSYKNHCPEHRVQTIYDKPVQCRAWASLPATYLSINRVYDSEPEMPVYGVFAKKTIPKRTQFGPVEGVLIEGNRRHDAPLSLIVEDEKNVAFILDTSNEMTSNWMRFVRVATNFDEMNLMVVQQDHFLYFNTTKTVNSRTELRVHYSPAYAKKWCLEHFAFETDQPNKAWPCFECEKEFSNSIELQHHLNEHDSQSLTSNSRRNRRKKGKARKVVHKIAPDATNSFATNDVSCNLSDGMQDEASDKLGPLHVPDEDPASPALSESTNTALVADQNVTHGKEEFKCNSCDMKFHRKLSLRRHQTLHSDKTYKCPICDLTFCHVYDRNRHMRKHKTQDEQEKNNSKPLFKVKQLGGSEWLCTHCNLTFDNSSLLNLHTLTHAAENVSMNDGVSATDSNSSQVSINFQNAENSADEELLKCPQCTKEFFSKKELILHASTHGKLIKKKVSKVNHNKPFKCKKCYKVFVTEEKILKHMLCHGSDEGKPFQCSLCTRRFMKNSALICHLRSHSNEKMTYVCPICKVVFDSINLLRDHAPIHCINGIYSCTVCSKRFEKFSLVKKHYRLFHSDKRYPCDQCDKVFLRLDKLKLHLLRHSDHKEFLCANCGKQFKRKDKLKEHMKKLHSGDKEKVMVKPPLKVKEAPKNIKKFSPKVMPSEYHRFIYKCHDCLLGFKRRGMLVNHLAKKHPEVRPDSIPELNLPILKTTKDYFCQHCDKVYKSSSKRKSHILKVHPGAELPSGDRRRKGMTESLTYQTYSQTVGSVTTYPRHCDWCHKQYATKSKLIQHQRKKHPEMVEVSFVSKEASTEPAPSSPTRPPDILTQAMSELTQRLSEFRSSNGTSSEYLQLVANVPGGNPDIVGFKLISCGADGNPITQDISACLDSQELDNNQTTSEQSEILRQLLSKQFMQNASSTHQTQTTTPSQLLLDESALVTTAPNTLTQLTSEQTFMPQVKDSIVASLQPTDLTLTLNSNIPGTHLSIQGEDQTILIATTSANSDSVIHAEIINEDSSISQDQITAESWVTNSYADYAPQ